MTETAVSLDEYLTTSYRPDCDYLDGSLLERNVGEWDHSRMQMLLSRYLSNREEELGILVAPEQRVQVTPTRYRIPDILVLTSPTESQIITKPPFLCIEILSPRDRMVEMQARIDDYLNFGVKYVWVIDPKTRRTHICTLEGMRDSKGILTTINPDITVVVAEFCR